MALVLVPTHTSTSADCDTVVITDSTGSYNVSTNPTGYGSPNQARGTLALKMCLSLRRSTGREQISVDAYNEFSASTWSVTITEDGWYEIYFFGCLAWSNAITYAEDYIAYDSSTDKFYRSLQASNLNHAVSDTAWWIETTDVEDFAAAVALSQPDTYQATENWVELCRTRKCEASMLVAAGCDCDGGDSSKYESYRRVRSKVEAVVIQEADDNFTEAQEIVEDLQAICANETDCGCN